MLRCFIKYKNETNEQILKLLKIDYSQVLSFNYLVNENNAVLYLVGKESNFILVDNILKKDVTYVFDENILSEIKNSDLTVSPGDFSVGNFVLTKTNLGKKYIVQPLDTLNKIANKFGLSEDLIIKSNNLKTSKLFIGQILWI